MSLVNGASVTSLTKLLLHSNFLKKTFWFCFKKTDVCRDEFNPKKLYGRGPLISWRSSD
jgi:hypothetical protein